MNYLSNAFSLQMLENFPVSIKIETVNPGTVPSDAVSCISHADTAAVVSNILGRDVEVNRISVKLSNGDVLYVAQLTGGRLPEGTTKLPKGFNLTFLKVTL